MIAVLGSDSEACALSTLMPAHFMLLLRCWHRRGRVSVSPPPANAYYVLGVRLVPSKWQIERLFLPLISDRRQIGLIRAIEVDLQEE